MGIESATWIGDLDETLPAAGDNISQADDHMRLIKDVLKNQFTSLGSAAVTATAAEINTLNDTANNFVTSFNTRQGDVTPAASDYDADQVDYDNATSGLTATNVQDAVDEVAASIADHWVDLGTMTTTGTQTLGELTNVPAGCDEIVIILDGVTVSNYVGGDQIRAEIGDSGSYATTSVGMIGVLAGSTTPVNVAWPGAGPAGLGHYYNNVGYNGMEQNGLIRLVRAQGTNKWAVSGTTSADDSADLIISSTAGLVTHTGEIDRIKITTTTYNFTAGTAYIRARVG